MDLDFFKSIVLIHLHLKDLKKPPEKFKRLLVSKKVLG